MRSGVGVGSGGSRSGLLASGSACWGPGLGTSAVHAGWGTLIDRVPAAAHPAGGSLPPGPAPRVLRRVNATWVGFRFLTRPMAPRTLWGILTLGQEPDVSGVSLVPARGVALGAIGTGLRVPVRLGSVLCIMRPLGTRQRVGESA